MKKNVKFDYRIPLMMSSPMQLNRINEPIVKTIQFLDEYEAPEADTIQLLSQEDVEIPIQFFNPVLAAGKLVSVDVAFLCNIDHTETVYYLCYDAAKSIYTKADDVKFRPCCIEGISQLPTTLKDGFRRLDTGYYILEFCRGNGGGDISSKWGIRSIQAKAEGKDLMRGTGENAMGGLYGPFFTVNNGLINAPETTVAEIDVLVEGPLYCKYLLHGMFPNGLDPKLYNKEFKVTWEFFYMSPWFRRYVETTPFETTVDGMPVKNQITVGDEFDSGPNNVVFDRFASYGGTDYREGDRYAVVLEEFVLKVLKEKGDSNELFRACKEMVGDNIHKLSWDYFWQIFGKGMGYLSDEEIKVYSQQILKKAHYVTHMKDGRRGDIKHADFVNVPDVIDQTIFPTATKKTMHYSTETGYGMIWYTSNPSARLQIVQKRSSGWVNWGSNGENEYPALPIPAYVYNAYCKWGNWENEADKMEYPIEFLQGIPLEKE